MRSWFFHEWSDLARILTVACCSYVALIALLRISGKRTLSKLNAFDLVVTVALGSTFATILLSNSVSLAEGITALVVLVGLQYVVAWSVTRSPRLERLVKSEPTLVAHQGRLLHGAMKAERLSEEEVEAAARASGLGGVSDTEAVVLESDGSLSVLETNSSDSRRAD